MSSRMAAADGDRMRASRAMTTTAVSRLTIRVMVRVIGFSSISPVSGLRRGCSSTTLGFGSSPGQSLEYQGLAADGVAFAQADPGRLAEQFHQPLDR